MDIDTAIGVGIRIGIGIGIGMGIGGLSDFQRALPREHTPNAATWAQLQADVRSSSFLQPFLDAFYIPSWMIGRLGKSA